MSKVNIYNQKGEKIEEARLNPAIFGLKPKKELLHQVAITQLTNARIAIAHTKTRGEVRGGGRKPWRQKGTGRARVGSARSPLWKGGGVIFGPRKDRLFVQKINKKAKRKALLMCLSDKARNNWIILLDKLNLEKGKTKELVEILKNLKFRIKNAKFRFKMQGGVKLEKEEKVGSLLIALPAKDDNIIRAARNIPGLATLAADSLNVIDLLKYKYLLITKDGLRKIEKVYK